MRLEETAERPTPNEHVGMQKEEKQKAQNGFKERIFQYSPFYF